MSWKLTVMGMLASMAIVASVVLHGAAPKRDQPPTQVIDLQKVGYTSLPAMGLPGSSWRG